MRHRHRLITTNVFGALVKDDDAGLRAGSNIPGHPFRFVKGHKMLMRFPVRLNLGRRLDRGVILAALLCGLLAAGIPAAQAQLASPPLTTTSPFAPPSVPAPTSTQSTAPSSQSASVNPGAQAAPPDYRLGPGDHVHIIVFGQAELTGDYQVDGSGKLAFPLIGDVQAGGLTADGLEREIEAKLSPGYLKNPQVSAEILAYRPFYILGEVAKPGSYPYVSGMTVLNAVALAGGFTPRAKKEDFKLERMASNGHRSDVDAGQDTPVQPGDVITVRERWF